MELKKSSDTTVENTDTTVNTGAFKNLPWSALHQSSKGADIISAINQLLSMYHPNDGILAYEHVIKTLLILSENLGSEVQQQIISVVPYPRGVPNDKVENLIYRTTELVKAANSVSACQKITVVPEGKYDPEIFNEKSELHLNQSVLVDAAQDFYLNKEFIPPVPELFKGFPPNEITTIHSHLSIDRVRSQCNVTNISHVPQQTYFNKKLYRNNVITNQQTKNDILNLAVTHSDRSSKIQLNNEILNSVMLSDANENLRRQNSLNRSKNLNIDIQECLGQESRQEQQAIQRDIHKMDVVCYDDEGSVTTSQASKEEDFLMDHFEAQKGVKTSLQNFLKRAEEDILIEFPILPRTKPLHDIPSTSKYCKFNNEKNLENDIQFDPTKGIVVNATESLKVFAEKKSSVSLQLYPKSSHNQSHLLHKNSNAPVSNKSQAVECEKRGDVENLLPFKSAARQTKQKGLNALQQTASITELATFKKQYYDTLLNIQKAKMAVTNSLAISSVEGFSKYDPYYSNHSYQRQQLLQQHGSLSISPQYAVHTMAQSGLSNVHNTPYTWMRYNNWKHPAVKQLKLPQQFPFHMSRNKE